MALCVMSSHPVVDLGGIVCERPALTEFPAGESILEKTRIAELNRENLKYEALLNFARLLSDYH